MQISEVVESASERILGLVPRGSRVLDLSGGRGEYLSALRDQLACEVTTSAADDATLLEGRFTEGQFDVAIFSDVLEHQSDPTAFLERVRPLVKNGFVIVIPNVSHAAVVYELLRGEFGYRSRGLLDAEHLRFFTKRSFVELLEAKGFAVDTVQRVKLAPEKTEFHTDLSAFPREIVDFVNSREDAFTYQYVIFARSQGAATVQGLNGSVHTNRTALEERLAQLVRENDQLKQQIDNDETEATELLKQLNDLRRQQRDREEQIHWYTQKLKESLLSLHVLSDKEKKLQQREHELWSEKQGLEHQYKAEKYLNEALVKEHNELGVELTRLRKYNPERLPSFLKVPMKALIVSIADGPFEPLRMAVKKKANQSHR